MRPVTSTIDVPQSRERVFAALDLLADHERFTDHFLAEWSEVVAAEPPRRSVEESLSAGGRRLIAPLTRAVTRRANDESLRRLAAALAAEELSSAGSETKPEREEQR